MDTTGSTCRIQTPSAETRKQQKRDWIAKKRRLSDCNLESHSQPLLSFSSDNEILDSDSDISTIPLQDMQENQSNRCMTSVNSTSPTLAGSTLSDDEINTSTTGLVPKYITEEPAKQLNLLQDTSSANGNVSSTSSDDNENSFPKSTNEESELRHDLRQWAVKNQIKHNHLDDLLKILCARGHSGLPLTARTLLGTPTGQVMKRVAGMEYIYLGFKRQLENIARINKLSTGINLSLNIDGLPLFKSTKASVWPVLCKVDNVKPTGNIFAVALAYGDKPNDTSFLQEAVDELDQLIRNGLQVNGHFLPVTLTSVMCDAPAKALVKSVKTYAGYYGCDRCEVKGDYTDSYVRFMQTAQLPLRTDQSFRTQANKQHHTGISPFTNISSIDMIKQFPNDYMHSVLLGVMRKLLDIWTRGQKPNRLSSSAISEINRRLTVLEKRAPQEFPRKPRSLKELDRFKATEFRLFLLYTGKIVLKDILPQTKYDNFMDLSIAMTILLSEKLTATMSETADMLLHRFVETGVSKELYGTSFMVYNVHSLLHLTSDAKHYGCLENCSCFPFENHLSAIKRFVRGGKLPLTQLSHRLEEVFSLNEEVPNSAGASTDAHSLTYKPPNDYFLDASGRCHQVVRKSGLNQLTCKTFRISRNLFELPVQSQDLGIYVFDTQHSDMTNQKESSLKHKAMLLKLTRNRVIVQKLLHFV